MTSSPHEVLAKLATLIDGEFDDAGDEVTVACEAWVYFPRLVAVARAALVAADGITIDHEGDLVNKRTSALLLADLSDALAALGGPDAPQEKPK